MQRKSILSNTLAPAILAGLVSTMLALPAAAAVKPGYWHEPYAATIHPDWMSPLRDTVTLRELSIPGTHDTMSQYSGDIVQTQSMALDQQLLSGVRVLDIRLKPTTVPNLRLLHGIIWMPFSFDDVLSTARTFLAAHPRETVFMRIKNEAPNDVDSTTFDTCFKYYFQRERDLFYVPSSQNPRLGDMRGKVVILQNFSSDQYYGLPYSNLFVQDSYALSSISALYDKWMQVQLYLNIATTTPPSDSTFVGQKVFVNHLSGATADGSANVVFPYFVASGKSSYGTGAAQLATGKMTPFFTGWPDFPRVSCIGDLCSIVYEGTNQLTYQWLKAAPRHRVGMIMADFPGPGLIDEIIALNDNLK